MPHGWGANLLMCNEDDVTPAPDSWGAVFDEGLAVQGQGHGIRLADLHRRRRAVPLEDTQPDLGITDPYALDQEQFDAAVDLLKQQKANIGEYWSDYLKEQEAFTKGSSVLGTTWQVITNLRAGGPGVAAGRGDHPQGGLHRVVRQLDGLQQDRSTRTARTSG